MVNIHIINDVSFNELIKNLLTFICLNAKIILIKHSVLLEKYKGDMERWTKSKT